MGALGINIRGRQETEAGLGRGRSSAMMQPQAGPHQICEGGPRWLFRVVLCWSEGARPLYLMLTSLVVAAWEGVSQICSAGAITTGH